MPQSVAQALTLEQDSGRPGNNNNKQEVGLHDIKKLCALKKTVD